MYADDAPVNPVSGISGLSTEHATGAVVLLALGFLILVRKGFRGVNVGGVGVSVR